VVSSWRAQGIDFGVHQVHAEPFWTTQEIAECPALLEATCALFREPAHAD
jgi:hypothetical protein